MSPRPTEPRHANRAPFTLLVLGILGGGLVLLLGLNTVSAANELRRHDFAARDEAIAASLVELRNAVAASAAPQNVALHAAAYGMVPAGNPAFLVVGPSGSVRVLGSPAPASAVPLPPASSPAKAARTKSPKPTSTASKSAQPATSAVRRSSAKTSAAKTTPATTTPARTTSARASTTSTHTSAAHQPHAATATRPAPSPAPARPSSTPVPTITLPGGTR